MSVITKVNFILRDDAEYETIEFNEIDKKYNTDRTSFHGNYKFMKFPNTEILVPRNPVGRTGICGRGHLGRLNLLKNRLDFFSKCL